MVDDASGGWERVWEPAGAEGKKKKEVIHYNFSSWLPAKQRKEHVLWDFPAGKNILTG